MDIERIFTWDELALFRFEGDDYGGVTAYCRTCSVTVSSTYNGKKPLQVGYSEFGDPVRLLQPVLEHIHRAHTPEPE